MKKHGGKRKGSGRKPLPFGEKKKLVRIFVKERAIKQCGGEEAAREIGAFAIENHKTI